MRIRTWNRRLVLAGCCAALGLATAAPVASAQPAPPPAPVAPITLSPEESQELCNTVLPRMQERVGKTTQRVTGGPDVRGSSAWLKAKAQKQREKGHPKVAERLEKRAERRAGRVDELNHMKQRLDDFRSRHCRPAGGA